MAGLLARCGCGGRLHHVCVSPPVSPIPCRRPPIPRPSRSLAIVTATGAYDVITARPAVEPGGPPLASPHASCPISEFPAPRSSGQGGEPGAASSETINKTIPNILPPFPPAGDVTTENKSGLAMAEQPLPRPSMLLRPVQRSGWWRSTAEREAGRSAMAEGAPQSSTDRAGTRERLF